ncbi:flagellar biosynthesis anti-sigma factor FlgM [Aquibacillus salsiterrae]|uniref:Negative regulator of flagellin synthesis n=1 Tax=Aquibacillus salsiterrae TaxID=2950439 RepID=A0A9X4AE62_9BACI|nr:flagellar biosynthesis anti-sigma factor FlgM [Aquibacillus salsiterrae]MDC3416124.1 flagellar biosynthesis anti-sigma factor FlgM [Aquibacillus salsiterrae]
MIVLKIQGPNHTKVNPYQQQLQKQDQVKNDSVKKADQLQISDEAKKLQEQGSPEAARKAEVAELKRAVQSGNYQVDAKQVAAKMLEFWKK